MKLLNSAILLIILASMLTACSITSTVPLVYPQPDARTPFCSSELTVANFQDQRADSRYLGLNADDEPIKSDIPGAEWISWAVFDELSVRGCQVSHRTSAQELSGAVLSGEVRELSLNESNPAVYDAAISVMFHLDRDGKRVWSQKFSIKVEETVFPGHEKARLIMTEALQELLSDAVPAILKAAQ